MTTYPAHLKALRSELKHLGLGGFFIPLTDEHMSEYVGDYAQRLHWVTGFEGSAGNAVVLADKAAIFIDGRYVIQVMDQVDGDYIERHHFEKYPLKKWLTDNMGEGARIGYDAELATVGWFKTMQDEITAKGGSLVAVESNPIDAAWSDQPVAPMSKLRVQDVKWTGKSSADKRRDIAEVLKEKNVDAVVVTMLDCVAWAYNIRADDVHNTPVPHAFAILRADESGKLFVASEKLTDAVRHHLGNSVEIKGRTDFYDELVKMGKAGERVLVDPASNNAKIFETLKSNGATLIEGADPCIMMKAVKNSVEQQGTRDAHIRDGAAISEFLAWFSVEAPKGKLDEIKAAAKLWSFRAAKDIIQGISFDTISAAGSNAALCHYKVSKETNLPIKNGEIFLLDSGGQYSDGTTDITRTMIVGTPTAEHKDRFTRVLKGHIALSSTHFPKGTSGQALDAIARKPLWDIGLDYDHGTGHGVGSYLAVHEGPQRIAKFGSGVALQDGMILSNEPGYYKAGEFGIRIENLVLVKNDEQDPEGRGMMHFENLTWAPIDHNLIEVSLLSSQELAWLNSYHATVREKLLDIINPDAKGWLLKNTEPLTY